MTIAEQKYMMRAVRMYPDDEHGEAVYQLSVEHVRFLHCLMSRLYSEDRFTGDEMRDTAQRLDAFVLCNLERAK